MKPSIDLKKTMDTRPTYDPEIQPNVKAHAIFRAIVENQIAMGLESVNRAVPRLMKQV